MDGSARLAHKLALVTGGGTGIGAAIAKRFAEAGARVVICGRRAHLLEAVVAQIAAAGGEAEAVPTDVSDEAQLRALFEHTLSRGGRLDVLVNNAMQMAVAPIAGMTTADWRKNLAVSLDAAFFALREALPVMARQGGGSILNISSLAGRRGERELAGYCTAKAGLENLTRAAAIEGAPHRVRVNSLCLGMIATEAGDAAFEAERRAAMEALIPLGRFGTPREIAHCALFLASDEASFITGSTLVVDGGQSAGLGSPPLRPGHRN